MSSSVSTATDSAMNDTVTSATPFAGMLWFIVRIFAPVSVKIDRTAASLPGLSCSLMCRVVMLSRFMSRNGAIASLYL